MSIFQQPSQELDTLVAITEILTGPLQFFDKCEAVLDVLAGFTGSDLVTLRELDPENFQLNPVASYNRLTPPDLPLSPTLPGRALNLRIPVVVNDYLAHETRDQGYAKAGVKSALIIPVEVDGEILGTLGFASKTLGHYQEDTVRVLTAIAAVVGMMLRNAELHQDNEVEANVGRIVSSPLVGLDVFERFTAEAAGIIEFDRLQLISVNASENTFVTEFHFGGELPNLPMGIIRKIDGSALEKIARSCVSQRLTLDEREGAEPRYPNARPFVIAGQRFFLGVPLVVGDQVIGALGLTRASSHFSHKDLTKAERLGNLVAGAFADFKIQEFKTQTEQEIKKNRAVLEAEANIGRFLSSPIAKSDAIETIKSELANIVPLDRLVILNVDIEAETFSQDFNEFLYNTKLLVANNPGQTYAGSITEEVIRSGCGQIINSDDPRLATGQLPLSQLVFENKGYQSMMVVPLEFEGITIGVLLSSRYEGQYCDEDVATAERIGHLLSGALATFKITSERNRAQLALLESESRLRQIADSIDGVFWLVDFEPRRLVYASPNFEDVYDIPVAAVYDNLDRWYETVHPEDLPRLRQTSRQVFETGEAAIEHRIIKRDGSVRWVRSNAFPVRDDQGKIFRTSGFAEDITDRKLQLERITEAGRLLSIGELASGVAHEINNPLANVSLYSEDLLEQDLPDSVISDLRVILAEGKRAAAVVGNLLQFARKSSPEISKVDAREFVERCIKLKSHDFRVNNISASVSVELGCPELKIDDNLMSQVVLNILANAEQACVSANGRGHISVTVREAEGSTRISVSDNGPGISPENQLKVFDPFFTTKEVGEGTGLGLSVSYGIIAQLGGKLWVESDGLIGSTFHIDIPPVMETVFPETNINGNAPPTASAASLHVLVVDDEPDLRFIFAKLVERQGHSADQAGDGEEAWRKVQDNNYDCILLDLRMAGSDGQEVFQRISSSDPDLADNIIFITGDLANSKTRSFLNPLPNLVLEKPISIEQLGQAIRVISERRSRSKSSD
ncbi:MAG: hypothetical protein BZY87_02465 [SAR202 cluster bacterium Io17-Chloro-G6]|nr:MAG: hypothetical protein BZY87_02465 [SAR202 cluster bacterium Io17-Chloro-G6]